MKIAILTSGILPIPAVQGGAVENLIDFYLEYNDLHHLHDITVYSVSNKGAKRHSALQSTANHYKYIDTSSPWAKVRRKLYRAIHNHEYYNYCIEYFFEEVYKDISRNQYDCIIMENRPGYVHKLANRGLSNLVLHLHNDLLNSETPYHKEILSNLKQVLTVSEYIKGRVSSIAPSEKIQTIHNGIDLQKFSRKESPTVDRHTIGLKNDDFVIVFSGRINRDKGVSELIESLLQLQDLPSLKLLVIGSTFFGNASNEDDFVRTLKKKAQDIEGNIIFTGFIPYDLMPDYLQMADVAVIPSIWNDPFPTTVLEAQAMGLPIITTNRGGIPEEVGKNNALIVSTENNFIKNLANAIRQLYFNPEQRNAMSLSSLQHSMHFSKERFAEDFFNALEKTPLL